MKSASPLLSLLLPGFLLPMLLGATISGAAERIDGERVTYFATEEGAPAEIRIHQSTEAEAAEIVVKVFVFDPDGLPVRVFESGLAPLHEETEGRQEFRGRGTFDGAPVFWAVELSEDGSVLDWRAPVSVELRDGRSVELSGEEEITYRETPDAKRLEQARAAFARQDTELNRLYGELKAQLETSDFDALRDSQRQWIAYRDRWTADGDNSALEGPGSIAHTWRQASRTRDRIAYLRAFGRTAGASGPEGDAAEASGAYSDGKGNRLSLRFLQGRGPAWFSLRIDRATHEPAASDPYLALWGLAKVGPPGTWIGHPSDCSAYRVPLDSNQPPEELDLEPRDHGVLAVRWWENVTSGTVDGDGPGYEARFLRVADLTAATEPMGSFLATLPADAFGELTDPPGPEQREELAATGQTRLGDTPSDDSPDRWHGCRIETTGPDYLRLTVPFGRWTLCRFPRPDGTALLVVQTRQQQNEVCRFWECDAEGKTFTEVEADHFLPELTPRDFYSTDADAEAALARHGHPMDQAAWQISEPGTGGFGIPPWIELHYPATRPAEGEAQPTRHVVLPWTGTGFGFEIEGGLP